MKRGALIFAFNNGAIDYVRLAEWTAKNIKRHLDIPVAVVTDVDVTGDIFDHVIYSVRCEDNGRYFSDIGDTVAWHNKTRPDAYDLSPWDETLVLDADYIVASDQLKTLFNSNKNFQAYRWTYDITNSNDFIEFNHFGRYNMPMWWATVMHFRRSDETEFIFDIMKMVRDNWRHYCDLYASRRGSYRNDHALSIALNLVNGHTQPDGIPWPMASLIPDHRLKQIDQDIYRVEFIDGENRAKYITVQGQDFHAMGKRDLGDIVNDTI